MTHKLYLEDSLLLEFEARITSAARFENQPSLILNRSAFYGEAGGQLGDRGELKLANGTQLNITDCQYDDQGILHHLLDEASLKCDPSDLVDQSIVGYVDATHRRDMMSQHTGQHLLSAVFDVEYDAETVSARLGSTISTMDLGKADLSDKQIAKAVDIANNLILENRNIRPLYPNAEELEAMNLRRLPKVTQNIRIIEIEGYDFTPCGGTHCRTTGEIGPVYVLGKERYKGGTRVKFISGGRVLSRLDEQEGRFLQLGKDLGCGAVGVEEAVVKIKKTLKEQSDRLGATRARLVALESDAILAEHPANGGRTLIPLIREDGDSDELRAIAAALVKRPDVVVIAASRGDNDWRVILDAGKDSGFDAGGWFKTKAKELGGRGGGRPHHAEGRFADKTDFDALIASL